MSGLTMAASNSGRVVNLDEQVFAAFSSSLRGACLTAASPGYDEARGIWNALADKHPAIIVQCTGAADVIEAVNFARQHGLLVAVRGGGHNVAGNATCDGGLVIDLSKMRTVRVDPVGRRAWAGGGATIGDVDHETQAFGLATPLGIVSETGIAGLTLCGGLGWLRSKHGMSCDSLVSADVVTADGQLVTASATENSDLFWSLRGGGGNFGIVISFEYQLHPVGPMVTMCAPFYALDRGGDVIRRWRDYVVDAPDDFTSAITLWSIPPSAPFPTELHGEAVVIPAGVHIGKLSDGAKYIQPLRELGKPLLDLSGPWTFKAVQTAFDPFFAKGERLNYWKSLYLDKLDDEVIDRIVARAQDRPSPWALIDIWKLGGAMARVRPEETALGARDAPFLLSIDTSWTDSEQTEQSIAWTRAFWAEMRPFARDRVYLNFPGQGEEGEALLRASYGDSNYERLVDVKCKYDPKNLFRLNQNIRPRSI